MISIIIPTHNRADQLKHAIDSLLPLEGETEFEIVVVDNNSSDGTKALAASYPEKVRYVFEGRTSFTRARTTGGEQARGGLLLYLDDDVIVNPGSLRKIAEVFAQYPDCGVIAGQIWPRFTEDAAGLDPGMPAGLQWLVPVQPRGPEPSEHRLSGGGVGCGADDGHPPEQL